MDARPGFFTRQLNICVSAKEAPRRCVISVTEGSLVTEDGLRNESWSVRRGTFRPVDLSCQRGISDLYAHEARPTAD
jgi:hypothetical protein